MACIAKRRRRYVIDFYDTYGKRRWIIMPKGTTKKKARGKLREIEDQLGHSSPTVTLNIYAHLMKSVNQEAALKLENTVFRGN